MSCIRIASVLVGAVTLCSGANPHSSLGGYQPVSTVIEHAQIVHDIEAIKTALSSGDFATAKTIYTSGMYSCKTESSARTLQGFVNAATVTSKLAGQAFFDSFTNGNGPSNPNKGPIPGTGRLTFATSFWDDFILGALDASGDFSSLSVDMRKYAVNKGVLGVLTMYVARELESAIKKADAGSTADGSGAPHAWDEGWAFYYGNHTTAGKYSAWEFAKKRDLDYAYDSSGNRVSGTTEVKTEILRHFLEGLKACRTDTLSLSQLVTTRNNIYRLLALTSIRAGLKYAYKMQNPSYSAAYHMEAYAYFLAAAGWIQQAAGSNTGAAKAVLDLIDFKLASTALNSDVYCAVKAALIPVYSNLGLSCEMVGTWKSLPATKTCANLPACPAGVPALPTGLASFTVADPGDQTAGDNLDCGTSHPDYPTSTTGDGTASFGRFSAVPGAVASLLACLAMWLSRA
jgi:hypothetical protein